MSEGSAKPNRLERVPVLQQWLQFFQSEQNHRSACTLLEVRRRCAGKTRYFSAGRRSSYVAENSCFKPECHLAPKLNASSLRPCDLATTSALLRQQVISSVGILKRVARRCGNWDIIGSTWTRLWIGVV